MTLRGEVHDGVGSPQHLVGEGGVGNRSLDETDARIAQHLDDVLATPGVGERVQEHDVVDVESLGVLEEQLGESRTDEPSGSSYHNAHGDTSTFRRGCKTSILIE